MARNHDDPNAVRQYLLRQLSDDEQRTIEQRLLAEDELFEELEVAEDELIDEYLAGSFSESERKTFEWKFLAAPERKQKLRFAEALKRHMSTSLPHPVNEGWLFRLKEWLQQSFASPLVVAAVVLIVAGLGFAVWRGYSHQSDVDRSLIALNAAYNQQRPLESRITQLNYAPFVTTRGPGPNNVNEAERQRAELMLLEALNKNPTPAVHHALGKVYLAKYDFDRAIEQFEQALKADPNNAQIYADLGAGFLEKGKLELEKGKSDRTSSEAGKGLEDLGRSLENLNKALDLNPNLLEALFNRALCYQYLTLPRQAEETWRNYLAKDSSSPWAEEANRNLKLLEQEKTKAAESEQQLQEEFLNAFQNQEDDKAWEAVSRSRRRTGNAIFESLVDNYLSLTIGGQPNEADDKLKRMVYAARMEQEKTGDRFTSDLAQFYTHTTPQQRQALAKARSQMRLANTSFNKGEFEEAIARYSEAKEAFANVGDTPEALFAEAWMGYGYLRIPKVEASIEIFTRLSRIFESRNYKSLLAQSLNALADAESSLNEFSRRLEYANQGLKESEEIEDRANAVRCLTHNLSTYLILGDYRRALESLNRALTLAAGIPPEPKLTWPIYHEAALDFHFLGLPATALAFEREALHLANVSEVPLLRSRSWERLGILYGQQKDYAQAIESGERALAEAKNIIGQSSRENVMAHSLLTLGHLHSQAGNPGKALKIFDQSLNLYKDLDFNEYSYEAHKGKLLTLIALNEDGAADLELNTVLDLFEENRTKITDESNRDKFFDVGQDTYDLAVDWATFRRKNDAQAFAYAEASRARSLFEMMSTGVRLSKSNEGLQLELQAETTPLALPEIQRRMPEQVQLLEYAVIDDKVLMWVVTKSFIKGAHTNIAAGDLAKAVRDFIQLLSQGSGGSKDSERVFSQAKQLHDSLISPVEGFLDKNLQLCIVADKSLNSLPFAALISQSSGKYLIESYQLEQAPSATIFIRCSEEAKKRTTSLNERLLSVGNPRFTRTQFASLPDLPAAAREASEIAGFYRAGYALVGEEASLERVRHALNSADVIHLATHALEDERSPLLSKLLLTSSGDQSKQSNDADDALRASEIYQLNLPHTRLVVLSACQTGIERFYRGEGAIGLARPFIAAGVPLVVASLWPVESEATADLMISFHKHRKQDNVSTVQALRLAQLEFLHNRPPGSQSHNGWAAFVTIGGYAGF